MQRVNIFPRTDRAQLLGLLGLVAGLALAMLSSGGCQTTEGFGEDLEDLGENISEEAREHD